MKRTIVKGTAALLLLSGCVSYERCAEKYGTSKKDTVTVYLDRLVPVAVVAPADSISGYIPNSASSGVIRDSTSQIEITYWRDKFNRLLVSAKRPPQVIHDTVPIRDTIRVPYAVAELKKPPPWYAVAWEWLKTASVYLLLATMLTVAIFKSIRSSKAA